MPAFIPIVINDGKATPVAHTFSPETETDNVWSHVDQSASAAIGFSRLKLSLSVPTSSVKNGSSSNEGRVYRAKAMLSIPVLESTSAATGTGIAPAPTVAYVLRANVEFIIPERCSLADRKDLNALLKNTLANSQWTSFAESLQNLY